MIGAVIEKVTRGGQIGTLTCTRSISGLLITCFVAGLPVAYCPSASSAPPKTVSTASTASNASTAN